MRMVRYGVGAVVLAGVLSSAGFAARLHASAQSVGAGSAVVAPCDPHATWTFGGPYVRNADGQVTALTVGHMAATCQGGSLTVTVTDAAGGHRSTSGPVRIPSATPGDCSRAMPGPSVPRPRKWW